jgi:hypothetical protein
MIEFYAALGLAKAFDHESGSWAVFRGSSGALAVHGLADAETVQVGGLTSLNFAVADVSAAADELAGSGLEATSWDEPFGTQGAVLSPDGRAIGLNEDRRDDLYGGYRVHEQVVAASLDVVAVVESADFPASAAFFRVFGFTPFGSLDDPWWCDLRSANPRVGVIGLHGPAPAEEEGGAGAPDRESDRAAQPPPLLVRLSFETSEPLDALAARLVAAGYPSATVVDAGAGSRVEVNDPDGQRIQIRPTR